MRFVAAYDYVSETGELLFQVVRWEPKFFSQRQPDGQGGWKRVRDRDGKLRLSMIGCRMVPYHLDMVAAAERELREDGVVPLAIIVEGEKDADRLIRGGFLATTNAGGSDKWDPDFSRYFEGFDCVLLPDNDMPGRRHMAKVARSLMGVARLVKIVQLRVAPKGDFSNWADAGGTPRALRALIAGTTPLTAADSPAEPVPSKRAPARLPDRLSAYPRAAIEQAAKRIREAQDGQQSATLNKQSFGLGQLVAAGLLPEAEALSVLLDAAEAMVSYDARRPWRPVELDKMVRRSFGEGLRQPRGTPADRCYG